MTSSSFWHACVVTVTVAVGLGVAAATDWAATVAGLGLSGLGLAGAWIWVYGRPHRVGGPTPTGPHERGYRADIPRGTGHETVTESRDVTGSHQAPQALPGRPGQART